TVLSVAEDVNPLSIASHCLSSTGVADAKLFVLQLFPPSLETATSMEARPSRSAKYKFPWSSVITSESPPPAAEGFGRKFNDETRLQVACELERRAGERTDELRDERQLTAPVLQRRGQRARRVGG